MSKGAACRRWVDVGADRQAVIMSWKAAFFGARDALRTY
jgi:hypothetical protein